jgi:hypothetical protein
MMIVKKLPVFPENEFKVGDLWITKVQLRKAVIELFPEMFAEDENGHNRYKISSKQIVDGSKVKKYAWHSILDDLNKAGKAEEVLNRLCDLDELIDA